MKTVSRATLGMVLVATLCGAASAAHWRIVQLTDNTVDDHGPRISAGHVVWASKVDTDYEIMYYDGHTTQQLTANDVDDLSPCISVVDPNVTVCWHAVVGPGRTREVFYFDGAQIARLTDNSWDDREAACWDRHIVWRQRTDRTDWELFDYHPRHGVRRLTDDEFDHGDYAVWGPFVAWARNTGFEREIWFYDGTAAQKITSGDAAVNLPVSLSGGHAAWLQWADGNWEVFDYHVGGHYRRLTFGDHDHHGPVVFDETIAWSRGQDDHEEILYYDGQQVRQLTYNGARDRDVRLAERWVVYLCSDPETERSDVVVYDLQRGYETPLAGPYDQNRDPHMDGDAIVWMGWDGEDYEIMLAVACEEMPGDTNGDCVVNLLDLADVAGDWTRCTAPDPYCP